MCRLSNDLDAADADLGGAVDAADSIRANVAKGLLLQEGSAADAQVGRT